MMISKIPMPYGHVIEDTKVLLERVESVAIKHVNRSGNKVAHSLSQMAISQMGDFIWLKEIPQCIFALVLAEQATAI